MLLSICYFLIFLLLFLRYRKRNKKSVGSLLLAFYAMSALLTAIIAISPSFYWLNDLDWGSTSYYVSCFIISLLPYLYLGKLNSLSFQIPDKLIHYLSIFLIIFGVIQLFNSLTFIIANFNTFLYNIASVREGFYSDLGETVQLGFFDKILVFVRPLQFMSPFCFFFFLIKRNKKMATWSAIASLSVPLQGITIGEREAILVFFSNYAFCYLFFRPEISESLKGRIKRVALIAAVPFMLFFMAMSFGRFGESQGGVATSFLSYGGKQPYFFAYLFNDPSIEAQKLGGRFCFQYLFPSSQRAWRQLNEYITSDVYLNQFGGMPGSLFLDFGYYSIFVVILIAVVYYILIKTSKRTNGKYPFYILFLFYFSYQVLFVNIFFLRYIYLTVVFLPAVFFLLCWLLPNKQLR